MHFFDVFPSEIGLHSDGTHRLQRRVDFVGLVDEHCVLIDIHPVNGHKTLSDGLDVTDAPDAFAERCEQAQTSRGLAIVLFCGRHKNAGCDRVHCVRLRHYFAAFHRQDPKNGGHSQDVVLGGTA